MLTLGAVELHLNMSVAFGFGSATLLNEQKNHLLL
jgi:hypothetical protein